MASWLLQLLEIFWILSYLTLWNLTLFHSLILTSLEGLTSFSPGSLLTASQPSVSPGLLSIFFKKSPTEV